MQFELKKSTTKENFNYIIAFFKNANVAQYANYYTIDFTLENMLELVSASIPQERVAFTSLENFYHAQAVTYLTKQNVKQLFESPEQVEKVYKILSQFGSYLLGQEIINCSPVQNIRALMKEPEIRENLRQVKNFLKKGQLINCIDIFPNSYFYSNPDGVFVCSDTAYYLRNLFGYYRTRIKCLTQLGFIYSTQESVMTLIKNTQTGVISKFTGQMDVNSYAIKELNKNFKVIKFFKIVGIDRDKHNKAIIELNRQNEELLIFAHSKPHRPHKIHVHSKPHKPHVHFKPRTTPRRDAEIYFDETGVQTTVASYALQNHISLNTARSRLRKLASLPVQTNVDYS